MLASTATSKPGIAYKTLTNPVGSFTKPAVSGRASNLTTTSSNTCGMSGTQKSPFAYALKTTKAKADLTTPTKKPAGFQAKPLEAAFAHKNLDLYLKSKYNPSVLVSSEKKPSCDKSFDLLVNSFVLGKP